MRIPSQFDDDNLYRKKIPRGESVKTFRKLIRLALGLAVVVVVMLQAAKPAVYRPFFGHLPAKSGGAAASLPSALATRPQVSTSGNAKTEQTQYSTEEGQIASQLILQLSRKEQVNWTVILSRSLRGLKIGKLPDAIATTAKRLKFDPDLGPDQRAEWEFAVQDLAGSMPHPAANPFYGLTQKNALLAALDEAAVNRVMDGSVWRSDDFDSFYRALDSASQLPKSGAATVGALPLLQQPDVFFNQLVTIHGQVALVENIQAPENPYGIKDYWQLWIKPAEGADRPIVAVVPDAPRSVSEQAGVQLAGTEGAQISVVGKFLKRLAYKSGAGADLAPVVIGRITYAPFAQGEQTSTSTDNDTTVLASKFWLIVSISCIGGVGLAMLLMWRTSVLAKQSRKLRTAYRQDPEEFLKGLGEQSPDGPSAAGQEHS
ncbi:MAG TPA: hypothetical protein DEF45_05030 [Rhodopirellula sp.]|nr:hypothetical protein [Rhodopirellula sp.]